MPLTPWKKLREEVLADNGRWKYMKTTFLAPGNIEQEYFYVAHRGAVLVIAIDDDGTLPIARQIRPLFDKVSLEFCAGGKEDQEPLVAAQREFAEEINMEAAHWEFVGRHEVSPGLSTETMDIFIAWGLAPKHEEHDETEEFEHVSLTPDQIEEAIMHGEITDGMCISAWHHARPRVLEVIDQLGKGM